MTEFENLLLKSGNKELIAAYARSNPNTLSEDFMLAQSRGVDVRSMSVEDFLYRYRNEGENRHRQRVINAMQHAGIKTVAELLTTPKSKICQIKNLGRQGLSYLSDALDNAGCKGIGEEADICSMNISDFVLSYVDNKAVAVLHSLECGNITTVQELLTKSKKDLLSIDRLGTKGVSCLEDALYKFGYRLKN